MSVKAMEDTMKKRFASVALASVIMIFAVSGCIAVDSSRQFYCENVDGGQWLQDIGECCPRGCPVEPIENPVNAQERAMLERCEVCWLP